MNRNRFEDILRNYGQKEFLRRFESLDGEAASAVLKQAELLDFAMLKGTTPGHTDGERGSISPIETLSLARIEEKADEYRRIGLDTLRAGKVGAVVLAGGMGTRLGCDHAKGMCDIGVTRPVYIFQRMIENLLDTVKECGSYIRLFVMTSTLNDSETRSFFKEHNWFGYDPDYISFFVQDMSPCLDDKRRMFFESHDTIAMSPNGNGGFYSSMIGCGVDVRARAEGIEYLNVFGVDNVLQRIADPVFVGAVVASGCATGAKVVRKNDPDERVGVICLEDGAPSVVEYYEMTDEIRNSRNSDGEPAYNYGVILNYLFRIDSVDRLVREQLPVHMVKKKVPYYDEKLKRTIVPEEPNAYKLETLVLDLVRLTGSCLPFEVVREKEFAPIKNAEGIDSVETARALLTGNGYIL